MSKHLVLSILISASVAHAEDKPKVVAANLVSEPGDAPQITAAKPARKRFVTHANAGVVAASWAQSKLTTFADRQTTVQAFGIGEYLRPDLRLTVSVQLAEAAGGAPANASTLASVGVTPWLGWNFAGPVYIGAGPLVAPRNYGKNQLDLGVYSTAGVAFPIGGGFVAGASVGVPVMLLVKTTVCVAPTTFVAYRF